jgi:hypothetical protein
VLVACAALLPVNVISPQDVSRLCLTRSLAHLRVSADDCLDNTLAVDKASRDGHLYSDKAPGLAALELPAAEAVRLPLPTQWPYEYLSLWVVRVLVVGVAFVLSAFLVGRVSEGLAPGFGGPALVAFALGTLMAPFAAANFDHVPAAMLGLAAFLLAWRRRAVLAGLVAGAGLAVEYEAASIVIVLAVYVALQGAWPLARYAYGVLPAAALLWTYDWLAFGAPWRASYGYVANDLAAQQASGFFGIHPPRLDAIRAVFVGRGGLLVVSPVIVLAAAGLVLLARRLPAETAVCAAVIAIFLAINSGYFLPYGGVSPGPRFLVPALPFLALGLGPAFAAWPRTASVLAVLSVIPTMGLTLTWGSADSVPGTIWGALVALPSGSSRLAGHLAASALDWIGAGREGGAVVAALSAAAALTLALAGAAHAFVPARVRLPRARAVRE